MRRRKEYKDGKISKEDLAAVQKVLRARFEEISQKIEALEEDPDANDRHLKSLREKLSEVSGGLDIVGKLNEEDEIGKYLYRASKLENN